jgi:hypothetical protein
MIILSRLLWKVSPLLNSVICQERRRNNDKTRKQNIREQPELNLMVLQKSKLLICDTVFWVEQLLPEAGGAFQKGSPSLCGWLATNQWFDQWTSLSHQEPSRERCWWWCIIGKQRRFSFCTSVQVIDNSSFPLRDANGEKEVNALVWPLVQVDSDSTAVNPCVVGLLLPNRNEEQTRMGKIWGSK